MNKTIRDNKNFIRAITLLLGVILFFTFFSKTFYYSRLPQVTITVPCGGKLINTVEGSGRIAYLHTNKVNARQEGYVEKIYVKEGELVTEGQVLMDFEIDQEAINSLKIEIQKKEQEISLLNMQIKKIDSINPMSTADLEKQMSLIEKDINELHQTIKELNEKSYSTPLTTTYLVEIQHAQAILKNAQEQLDAGTGSQADVDEGIYLVNKANLEFDDYMQELKKETEDNLAEKERELSALNQQKTSAGLDSGFSKKELQFQKENAKLELDMLKESIESAESNQIVAKTNGIVAFVNVVQGSHVAADTLLFEIAPPENDYQVSFLVPEDKLRFVVTGSQAQVNVAGNQNSLTGNIQAVEPYGDGGGQYEVHVNLENTQEELAGKQADILIQHTSKEYSAIIPKSALQQDNIGYYVMALRKTETIIGEGYQTERVDVDLVDSDSSLCAISGFIFIEPVILTSSKPVVNGQQVRYVE